MFEDIVLNKIKQKALIVCFCLLQIVLLVVMVIVVINTTRIEVLESGLSGGQWSFDIDGLEGRQLAIIEKRMDIIRGAFLDSLSLNAENIQTNSLKGLVRGDSIRYKKFERQNIEHLSIVVDFLDVEQYCKLFFEYSEEDDNEYLMPNEAAIVFCYNSDAEIDDNKLNNTEKRIVDNYIDYFEFNDFSVWIDDDESNRIVIRPVKEGVSSSEKSKFVSLVKEAVESLGVSSDLFEYEVIDGQLDYRLY